MTAQRYVRLAAGLGLWTLASFAGCGDDGKSSSSSAESGTTGDGGTFGATSSSTTTSGGSSSSTAAETDEDTAQGAQCSVYDQDCPVGEKCVPWSLEADLVPDEIRCCPLDNARLQPGDACTVEGYFGSCIDDCDVGSFCLDIDDDGMGTCLAMCEGTPDNPICETDQSCLIYFAGVPLCFDQCDPLVQNCPEGNGCYPDQEAAGNTGFICLPTIGTSGVGDYCWLLSNCQRGLICVYPDFFPDCNGLVGCCTQLCDLREPDPCGDINPELECVPWFPTGQMPPQAYLQDVGACIIPEL